MLNKMSPRFGAVIVHPNFMDFLTEVDNVVSSGSKLTTSFKTRYLFEEAILDKQKLYLLSGLK